MYASTLKFIKNQIHNEQIYVNERARERRMSKKHEIKEEEKKTPAAAAAQNVDPLVRCNHPLQYRDTAKTIISTTKMQH